MRCFFFFFFEDLAAIAASSTSSSSSSSVFGMGQTTEPMTGGVDQTHRSQPPLSQRKQQSEPQSEPQLQSAPDAGGTSTSTLHHRGVHDFSPGGMSWDVRVARVIDENFFVFRYGAYATMAALAAYAVFRAGHTRPFFRFRRVTDLPPSDLASQRVFVARIVGSGERAVGGVHGVDGLGLQVLHTPLFSRVTALFGSSSLTAPGAVGTLPARLFGVGLVDNHLRDTQQWLDANVYDRKCRVRPLYVERTSGGFAGGDETGSAPRGSRSSSSSSSDTDQLAKGGGSSGSAVGMLDDKTLVCQVEARVGLLWGKQDVGTMLVKQGLAVPLDDEPGLDALPAVDRAKSLQLLTYQGKLQQLGDRKARPSVFRALLKRVRGWVGGG
eukprot:m.385082 g.385082  ORF g.385082 m.385082 type:complete len:382 (-) comp20050_c8_seq11:13-1158(-)